MDTQTLAGLPQRMKDAQAKRLAYIAHIRQCFQEIMQTNAGREVVEYWLVEARTFANGLKSVSNLQKVYGVSADYFLGQADMGRNILQFLTPEQVASIIKHTQKEDKDGRQ